jgi:hypothetical protein
MPVPPDLDALLLSCLAKDREQRPASARDLLRRLDAISLAEAWTEARAREWWATNLAPHSISESEVRSSKFEVRSSPREARR